MAQPTTTDPHGMRPLLVLVVARQPIARAGIGALLADRSDVVVVGQAGSAEEMQRLLGELQPDAIIASVGRVEPAEVAALVEVADSARPLSVVLLADRPNELDLQAVIRAGARAVLSPDAGAEEVVSALRAVSAGLLVLDPAFAVRSTWGPSGLGDVSLGESLTEREREVLQLLATGLPNKSIARQLGISEHTVKFHVGSILGKLDATSRTDAVTRAARMGVLAL